MDSLIRYMKMVPAIAFVLLFLFIGLKGCVMTLWTYPKEVEAYSIEGIDVRSALMVFMPQKETVLWYSDPSLDAVEVLLMRMRGTYGTHYVGPIWTTEGLFGYHWCPGDIEPVQMEIDTLNKYKEGSGDSAFPDIGERRNSVVYLGGDSLKWEGIWFRRTTLTSEQITQLYSIVVMDD